MALTRLGRTDDLRAANQKAVEHGVWATEWQRPSVSVRGHGKKELRAAPWWELDDVPPDLRTAVTDLIERLPNVAAEGVRLLREDTAHAHAHAHTDGQNKAHTSAFTDESEGITLRGRWLELVLFERGEAYGVGCDHAPVTCSAVRPLLAQHAARMSGCQIKFSAVSCDASVMPHTGRTDGRLRLHASLHVPSRHSWRIRAGDPTVIGAVREWREGKTLLLDDSFEHELWGDGGPQCCLTDDTSPVSSSSSSSSEEEREKDEARPTKSRSKHAAAAPSIPNNNNNNDISEGCFRLILIVDLWHPDLSADERAVAAAAAPI
jgi:hypothetical protein